MYSYTYSRNVSLYGYISCIHAFAFHFTFSFLHFTLFFHLPYSLFRNFTHSSLISLNPRSILNFFAFSSLHFSQFYILHYLISHLLPSVFIREIRVISVLFFSPSPIQNSKFKIIKKNVPPHSSQFIFHKGNFTFSTTRFPLSTRYLSIIIYFNPDTYPPVPPLWGPCEARVGSHHLLEEFPNLQ